MKLDKQIRGTIILPPKTGKGTWLLGLVFMLCAICFNAGAQTVVIATLKADSTNILIGDQLKLRLAVKHPKGLKVPMPVIKDSIGNMDFIAASKIDTIVEPTDEIYVQQYVVSAYDSGLFHAGPVVVFYKNGTGAVDSAISNVVDVNVTTLPVDTTRPFKAIKAPLDVPINWMEYLPYIIGAFVLLNLLVGAYLWFKKYRKQKPAIAARPLPKDPPHIWARKELKKLDDERLWQTDQVKLYYSRLTEILRLYLEYRYKWLALESTTEEIEVEMANYNLKEKAKENLLQILRTADLVKFAKMLPAPDQNIKAMESANKFIDFTEPREEELAQNQQK